MIIDSTVHLSLMRLTCKYAHVDIINLVTFCTIVYHIREIINQLATFVSRG